MLGCSHTEIVCVLAGQEAGPVREIFFLVAGGDGLVFEDGGRGEIGLVDNGVEDVVPHVLADTGACGYHGDVVLAKGLFGPDAGYHEQLWRLELPVCQYERVELD
jgi:hypothetical protein